MLKDIFNFYVSLVRRHSLVTLLVPLILASLFSLWANLNSAQYESRFQFVIDAHSALFIRPTLLSPVAHAEIVEKAKRSNIRKDYAISDLVKNLRVRVTNNVVELTVRGRTAAEAQFVGESVLGFTKSFLKRQAIENYPQVADNAELLVQFFRRKDVVKIVSDKFLASQVCRGVSDLSMCAQTLTVLSNLASSLVSNEVNERIDNLPVEVLHSQRDTQVFESFWLYFFYMHILICLSISYFWVISK